MSKKQKIVALPTKLKRIPLNTIKFDTRTFSKEHPPFQGAAAAAFEALEFLPEKELKKSVISIIEKGDQVYSRVKSSSKTMNSYRDELLGLDEAIFSLNAPRLQQAYVHNLLQWANVSEKSTALAAALKHQKIDVVETILDSIPPGSVNDQYLATLWITTLGAWVPKEEQPTVEDIVEKMKLRLAKTSFSSKNQKDKVLVCKSAIQQDNPVVLEFLNREEDDQPVSDADYPISFTLLRECISSSAVKCIPFLFERFPQLSEHVSPEAESAPWRTTSDFIDGLIGAIRNVGSSGLTDDEKVKDYPQYIDVLKALLISGPSDFSQGVVTSIGKMFEEKPIEETKWAAALEGLLLDLYTPTVTRKERSRMRL